MIKKCVFLFILCAAPLLPAFSRFSYGLIFAIAFCVSFLALLAARKLLALCSLKGEQALAVEPLFLLLCTALYAALVRLILPVEALALDFFIYLVPFAYLFFDALSFRHNRGEDSQPAAVLTAAAFPPALSLLRELFYFGTITFPAMGEAHSFSLFSSRTLEFTRFFGSLPGSLLLLGLALWLWNAMPSQPRSGALPKAPYLNDEGSSSS